MPPQSVEVAETIAALKRALRRERETPTQKQITSATNRGNKLKKGATFVHAGSLPFKFTQHGYKERIEHAGYQRYILDRKPKRFNEYGDELEDSESDVEADADAEDENPYGDIRLEELLRPITHPAELDGHPSLSQAYLDPALPDMLLTMEAKLRQERANLWRAKTLHRHFIGDESWIPAEKVEQSEDWDLFEPVTREVPRLSPGKKRKRGVHAELAANGVNGNHHVDHIQQAEPMQVDTVSSDGDVSTKNVLTDGHLDNAEEMIDVSRIELKNDTVHDDTGQTKESKDSETRNEVDQTGEQIKSDETATEPHSAKADAEPYTNGDTTRQEDEPTNEDEMDADAEESPPPPPRRITRALAANNTSTTATPPLSPISSISSSVDSDLLQPHPTFLLPPSIQIPHSTHQASNLPLHVAHSGLAIDELLETRRLLGMYIQKQEETIRGLEGVLGKLIKAKRMRDKVWEWCKAEGHVGEWSDGEDWVDVDAWGINASELRKGRDEETIEEEEIGRKGNKRRRARERD